MSITLMAYPTAFLISPQDAKNNKLEVNDVNKSCEDIFKGTLDFVRVRTNITSNELMYLMSKVKCQQLSFEEYILPNGIRVIHQISDEGMSLVLKGRNVKNFNEKCESFLKSLDALSNKNIRLINGQELFYYNYDTEYLNLKDVFKSLKDHGAQNIQITNSNEIVAKTDDDRNIRYYKQVNNDSFTLEIEQKISIVNINTNSNAFQTSSMNNSLKELKIETNIAPKELKILLKKANYLYYEGNQQTPLKNSEAFLNWELVNGHYVANFSGKNPAAISKEAEIIFRKMNIVAGRDLRDINNKNVIMYSYNTNYTDKNILLNTLTEHGASDIEEIGDSVKCKLFNMEMIYSKDKNENAYVLKITQVTDSSLCRELIDDLNDEYALNIQEMTYNKIKERLVSENLHLESETVLEDNSIVLTIEV